MIAQLHCESCHKALGINAEVAVCGEKYCQKVAKIRSDLRLLISDYVEHFKGRTPSDEAYREYFEKVGLEERYKNFAGIVDEESIPKCSRRVWFTMNISSVHQSWPDETGKLRNTIDA